MRQWTTTSNDVNDSNRNFDCAEIDTNNLPSDNNAENIYDSTQLINVYSSVVGNNVNNIQIAGVHLQDTLDTKSGGRY
jgi:hypothetical protein